jgi:hypothetical protein
MLSSAAREYLIAIESKDSARGGTRFADAVTGEGYTTALSRPTVTPSFAGTEIHSSHQDNWAVFAAPAIRA